MHVLCVLGVLYVYSNNLINVRIFLWTCTLEREFWNTILEQKRKRFRYVFTSKPY